MCEILIRGTFLGMILLLTLVTSYGIYFDQNEIIDKGYLTNTIQFSICGDNYGNSVNSLLRVKLLYADRLVTCW